MTADHYRQSVYNLVEQLADAESHASSESMAALEYTRNCTDLAMEIQFLQDQVTEWDEFCNSYPSIDVPFDVQDLDDVATGKPVEIIVTLERDIDEDDMDEDKKLN